MATTDSNGIVFVETTDSVSPLQVLLNALQTGTSNALTSMKGKLPTYTSGTRPAHAAGLIIFETDTKAFSISDGTAWVTYDTVWQSFTPSFYVGGTVLGTGGSTFGNGVISGRYFRTGKSVRVRSGFLFGSTTSYGALSGSLGISTPFTGASHTNNGWVGTTDAPQGQFKVTSGTTFYDGIVVYQGGNVDRVFFQVTSAGSAGAGVNTAYAALVSSGAMGASGQFVNCDYTLALA